MCFQAAPGVTFTDRTGAAVNVGLLPDCPASLADAGGPCVNRSASSTDILGGDGTTDYDIVIGVDIPAGTAGDPQMH